MARNAFLSLMFVALFALVPQVKAQTCNELDGSYVCTEGRDCLLGQGGRYLGFFGAPYALDSIMNLTGQFGSSTSVVSVRNSGSQYGNCCGSGSVKNPLANKPPNIFKHGQILARFSNADKWELIYGERAISLAEIDALSCTFSAEEPYAWPANGPTSINAADGADTASIAVTWSAVTYATSYNIYISTDNSNYTLIGNTSDLSGAVTGADQGVTYYVKVSALNSGGESTTNYYDTGYLADSVLYTVTASSSGSSCGSISPSSPQEVAEGEQISLSIYAAWGCELSEVRGTCGGSLSGGVYTTDPMTQNCTVIAEFFENPETAAQSCPTTNIPSADADGDSTADGVDNCPAVFNSVQSDVDNDGIGDACDTEDNRNLSGGLAALTDGEEIQLVYVGLLGRVADRPGFDYWFDEISSGKFSIEDLRHNIVNYQAEYLETLGLLSRYDLVAELYENLFTRVPDAAGHVYWTTGGGASVQIDRLVLALLNGAGESDTAALLNKAAAATHYMHNYSSYLKLHASQVIESVDSSMSSVETAKKSSCAYRGSSSDGDGSDGSSDSDGG